MWLMLQFPIAAQRSLAAHCSAEQLAGLHDVLQGSPMCLQLTFLALGTSKFLWLLSLCRYKHITSIVPICGMQDGRCRYLT